MPADLRRRRDVERAAQAMQDVDHRGRPVQPAEAQRGEAEQLGEGPGHDHVVGAVDQLDAGGVVVGADVFGIGGIDHQQHVIGQPAVQPRELVGRKVAAGRVVGVGDEQHPRPAAKACQQRVDVGAELALGRRYGHRPDPERAELVDQEAVRAVEHLVAGTGIGAHQQLDQFVRARAAHDPGRVQAESGRRARRASRRHRRPGSGGWSRPQPAPPRPRAGSGRAATRWPTA